MFKKLRCSLSALLQPRWFYLVWLLVMALIFAVTCTRSDQLLWLLPGLAVLLVYLCRPGSKLHTITTEQDTVKKTLCTTLVAVLTICACILPMDSFPLWNGEIPGHRNQYELMAENILAGRLHFEYGDEDQLAQLQNPYDPNERKESGVRYHWDHAFYNGTYYMYFGVVPVFLLFLPYRILTGSSLTTYHATQVFAAVFVAGMFALFYLLTKLFFKKMRYSTYLTLSAALSVMSVWYSSAEPALYCTAITAAIALEIWSLYFFIKAVWGEQRENRQILYAAIGAMLGALVFGCRPPIALANVLVIPMLAVFLRQRKFTAAVFGKLVLAALPYAVVAVALMLYNYARFENPFEFGQAYQITVADQSQYGIALNAATLKRILQETGKNLFGYGKSSAQFPFLNFGGAFINFPILLLTAGILRPASLRDLRQKKLSGLMIGLLVTVLIITAMDILWTPYLLERYRMDIYFLLGIACFISVGSWANTAAPRQQTILNTVILVLGIITLISSFLFFMRTTSVYYPDTVRKIGQMVMAWLGK